MTMKRTVLAVAASIILAFGGFVWFTGQPAATVTFATFDTPHVVKVTDTNVTLLTLTGSSRTVSRTTVTVTDDTGNVRDVSRHTTDNDTQAVLLDTTQLTEGTHTLNVTVTGEPARTVTFVIDRTAPPVAIDMPDRHPIRGETRTLTGTTDAAVTVTDGVNVTTSDNSGRFTLPITVDSDTVTLTATDQAQNVTTTQTTLTIIPSRVTLPHVRALHVSFHAWGDPVRRARIDALLDAGIVNAIQFDVKDESGHVGHRSDVAFANDTGAALNLYELSDVVAELHARNIPVIGRIVAFADPIVARYAYRTGDTDLAIQTPSGALYTGNYRGFTNFTHPTIINYMTDLALEAAAAGVDHILWDYLRRPDGRLSQIVIPGLDGPVEDAIVAFTAHVDEALYPWRIEHGASLYGISADRPREIGQDVAALSHHLDYVAPMIYPSHWGPGEYGVADPNRQPRAIVEATLNVWLRATENARARVIPWLEDTSYRAYDRPYHVREQHRGTYAVGIREWLMWDAGSRFTPAAYDVAPPTD